jgi:carbon-monoxide dehydrogenase iron sulfur subunit
MRTVFVHPERCIGCKQCEAACAVAHSQSKNLYWSVFESPSPKPRIHAEPGLTLNTSFPNKCHHCDPAPCLAACPTAAIRRAPDLPEIVLIDQNKCIACGMCAMVCPFDVITYHASAAAPDRKAVATKCDQCVERLRAGEIPACVEACKVGALAFGELNELVKAARTRYSAMVSAAVGRVPDEVQKVPDQIEGWRTWGSAVTAMNRDGHSNGRKGA